jgi:protein-disulfide isomerase
MKNNSLGVPIAIIVAGLIIALAVYFGGGRDNTPAATAPAGEGEPAVETTVAPVTAEDHIRGNPNAPIVLVEYSDYDCAFCKNFHDTMKRIMTEYGAAGTVAWVYRHFPLQSLHPNAPTIAAASECVAEIGGNEAFWTFSDLVFDERGVNALTDVTRLPEFAQSAGVDQGEFESCLDSGRYDEKIANAVDAAIATGAEGTPYTVILVGNQRVGVINGAQPYDAVKQNIDALIAQVSLQQ